MSFTARTWSGGSDDPTPPTQPVPSGNGHAYSPDVSLAGTNSYACSRCGIGMTPDQRYCVECGERRGKPRFTAAAFTPNVGATAPSPAPRARRRPRMSASGSTTLIAGIATLLLALGVGVLIGENNSSTPVAQKDQVITVQGGAPASTQAAAPTTSTPVQSTPTTASTTGTHAKGANGTKAAKTTKPATTASAKAATSAAAVQAANKAAQATLGSKNVGNATSTVGAQCTAGSPGCQNGKQTNNLFGGG